MHHHLILGLLEEPVTAPSNATLHSKTPSLNTTVSENNTDSLATPVLKAGYKGPTYYCTDVYFSF